ncbi:hypothetical protein SAMN02800694_2145 [Luteibacter sp. UNCMF331Sha3.1]|uniref:hypothetical protein n=1 Tax=Luteibacter sp. UNCMF331Sha3.1 TaxID=1502760 RepID=UPI000492CAD9|nr:hypothetical protein [Luteibacter sp. UNCMF331Sha3.1]SEM92091.1 hypothetical protein SAMN02800694_2145 [Luteibacter sp. UNCMF331Sha3.1]
MTNSSRNFLPAVLATLVAGAAMAQVPPPKPASPPPPRPVYVSPPPSAIGAQQWQRQVDRQQVQNQQNQNAVREQLRQGNLDRQRTNTTDPALLNQLDNADRSQQQLYRARQDDTTRRIQTPPRPDPETGRVQPAKPSSAGR